jgi:NADP-dependent 3-hydroxy acid dehydrogenase YdfG
MDTDLDGSTALITGASSGIGCATARELAESGADVALLARREERLREIADGIEAEAGRTALVAPTDVTDETQVETAVEEATEEFGGLDVVVGNAGLGRSAPVEEMTTEQYRQMMDVNVDGVFFLARATVPHLRESSGNLVLVGSFAGQYPRPANPVYAATKWWTRGFAHSLAGSVGEDGIGVTVVNPTEVRTEFGSEDDRAFEEAFDPGEVTEPEEVADAIAFAASQEPPTTVEEIDVYRRDKFAHF